MLKNALAVDGHYSKTSHKFELNMLMRYQHIVDTLRLNTQVQ